MRRREPARVLGPYQEGTTWRIIHIDGAGRRTSHRLGDEQAALRLKRKLERTVASEPQLTIGELIERYMRYLREVRVVRPISLKTVQGCLDRFFDGALVRSPSFTREAAEAWYRAHTEKPSLRGDKTLSVATHHLDLKVARRVYRWAEKKGFVRENPWQGIEPIGRARVGKPQLRVDEARRFMDGAFADLAQGDTDSLAPLMALLMGLRASEVMGRTARDVDDGGKLLWIDSGKTTHSRRHLRVPAVLAPHLAELSEKRKAEPFLFGATLDGQPPTHRLTGILRRLCRRHDVPKVCPHSLRGLYATLAMEQGAVADMVAASLGHTSFSTTARHYAQPQAVRHAKTERVLAVLDTPGAPRRDETPAEENAATGLNATLASQAINEAPKGDSTLIEAEFITPSRSVDLVPRSAESPLIALLSQFTRKKPARILGPYKNRQGYRLVVLDGPQRKSLTTPTLEQAEALRAELLTVVNHSQNLPAPDKS